MPLSFLYYFFQLPLWKNSNETLIFLILLLLTHTTAQSAIYFWSKSLPAALPLCHLLQGCYFCMCKSDHLSLLSNKLAFGWIDKAKSHPCTDRAIISCLLRSWPKLCYIISHPYIVLPSIDWIRKLIHLEKLMEFLCLFSASLQLSSASTCVGPETGR